MLNKQNIFLSMSILASPLIASELLNEDWRCVAKNAGDIKLVEVTSDNNLELYSYTVNPRLGLKFGDNTYYQGSCKLLAPTGSTITCEWDATRLLFSPDLATFALSDMSPSMGLVVGVVGSCAKIQRVVRNGFYKVQMGD